MNLHVLFTQLQPMSTHRHPYLYLFVHYFEINCQYHYFIYKCFRVYLLKISNL